MAARSGIRQIQQRNLAVSLKAICVMIDTQAQVLKRSSQVQPGFIDGNLFSTTNKNENVIGFFEIAAVSSKRIFFNYSDYFTPQDGSLPLFVEDCDLKRPRLQSLVNLIGSGGAKFVAEPSEPGNEEIGFGPYLIAPKPCVDCTVFGTNVVPDFWEE